MTQDFEDTSLTEVRLHDHYVDSHGNFPTISTSGSICSARFQLVSARRLKSFNSCLKVKYRKQKATVVTTISTLD